MITRGGRPRFEKQLDGITLKNSKQAYCVTSCGMSTSTTFLICQILGVALAVITSSGLPAPSETLGQGPCPLRKRGAAHEAPRSDMPARPSSFSTLKAPHLGRLKSMEM